MALILDGTDGITSSGGTNVLQDDAVITANIADGAVSDAKLASGVATPAGLVMYFAANTAPAGYLKANGAAISRTTFAALFAAMGTTYGAGDGSTTFALPDLRGEFPRGFDDGRGVDSGRGFGSAQLDQLQGHFHMVRNGSETNPPDTTHFARNATSRIDGGFTFLVSLRAAELLSDGVNGNPRVGSETRARNVALLACIKF